MSLGIQILFDFHMVCIVFPVKLHHGISQSGSAGEGAKNNGLLLHRLGAVNFFQQGQLTTAF